MRRKGDELERARAALARDSLGAAVRHAWKAGLRARRDGDEERLEAVIALAAEIRDRASGSLEREAESVRIYCLRCLTDLRAGIQGGGALWSLLRRGQQALKTCPDCAETIKAEARVCRFCGHRFAEPPA